MNRQMTDWTCSIYPLGFSSTYVVRRKYAIYIKSAGNSEGKVWDGMDDKLVRQDEEDHCALMRMKEGERGNVNFNATRR